MLVSGFDLRPEAASVQPMAQSPALHLVCLGTKWIAFDGSGKTDHEDSPTAHAKTVGRRSVSCPLPSAHPVGTPQTCVPV